jgi:hemoglobin-like flavoprotein
MGGIISCPGESVSLTTRHMMPIYYIEKEITVEDCLLVRNSWSIVLEGDLTLFYDAFYDRLFEINPSVKHLFKQNLVIQGKALMNMISAALEVLNNPHQLENALIDLAKRHTGYGVLAVQYGIIGEVLLWSLQNVLRENFTPQVEYSWFTVYNYILKIMIPAALAEERKAFKEADSISSKNGRFDRSSTKISSSPVSMKFPLSPVKPKV